MGNAGVTGETKVTKEDAVSVVLAAFKGREPGHKVALKDLASHLTQPEQDQGPLESESPQWRTSYQMMTARSNHSTGPFKSSVGMVLGGPTPRSERGAISWRKAIDSGMLSRNERMTKVRQMFDAMDEDHSRVVTHDEFVEDLRADGVDTKEAKKLFAEIDETRTGRLTLAKFDHYVAVHTLSMVRDTFKKLDTSKDRQITKKEFITYFLGNGLSKKQAFALWSHMDRNQNGKVNFVEYRDWASETLSQASLDDVSVQLGLST
mmetsp:Transcript_98885/g.176174  ORF Transcript_98885/g.176174 Transcript_98885/m.176174 type:complete len:263 (+) Transcript_98885:91-879(+)|eukprot:CAMPEP_0197650348 /NCGR_PEP_ID=MMETSP1338-20131121/30890_1 /TAXON_ID=43686 ORGANISM="Pelagodinium beii, Strain RCC1491" /NCGR_SAMPLE_ID=MMETSP1338 /ASSEMBLY_ACC=CAM_ASM_000754 /LENGTH=262 /DNA_ID=CAMNT_0043224735 /DNA_START=56 /DNA_END=844 /DNA_ORIENTATION=-